MPTNRQGKYTMNIVMSLPLMLQQIAFAGPSLVVYFFAGFMSVIFMSRARLPAILTLTGAAISVLTTIGFIVLQAYVISDDSLRDQRSSLMQTIGLASSVFRAVGLAFVVSAIFVGRTPPRPEDRYLRE